MKAINAVKLSKGAWIAVPDEDIIKAMATLGRTEGIFGEPAGVAAIAGIRKAVEEGIIRPDETVTTIVTGNGLKDPANGQKAVSMPEPMEPNLEILDKFLKEKGAI